MELHSAMSSAAHDNQQRDDIKEKSSSENIKWDQEISFEQAYRAIEGKFYSFKKVQLASNMVTGKYCLHSIFLIISETIF